MKITEDKFDNSRSFTISNGKVSFQALDYGCIIRQINVQGKNIVFSLPNLKDYVKNPRYYGAIVGRVANRIKNAQFELDGKTYQLDKNEGENCLHGGFDSYSDMTFEAKTFDSGVIFERTSPDGEQGFPGNLKIRVKYTLDEEKECCPCDYPNSVQAGAFSFRPKFFTKFTIEIHSETDKKTPVNMINHSYFNLSGFDFPINEQVIKLNSSSFLETDSKNLPTGKILLAKDYNCDLSKAVSFENAIQKKSNIFDNCFILDGGEDFGEDFGEDSTNKLIQAAVIVDNKTQLAMEVRTNQKATQLFTPPAKKIIAEKPQYECFALETQDYVDAVNHKNFPSIILEPVKKYTSKTEYIFFYS